MKKLLNLIQQAFSQYWLSISPWLDEPQATVEKHLYATIEMLELDDEEELALEKHGGSLN